MRFLLVAIISIGTIGFAECPDTGSTLFYKVENGINGYKLFSKESYWSLFVGSEFHTVSGGPPGKFWMDGSLLEWALIPSSDFAAKKKKASVIPSLKSFFEYEAGFLKANVKKGLTEMEDFADYTPIRRKGADGVIRYFKVWSARLGKGTDKKTQYWIANLHPRGAVVLSIIQMNNNDNTKVKVLIDSYIANYGRVSSKVCETLNSDYENAKESQ